MSVLFDKHIELIDMLNSAENEAQHDLLEMMLEGFRVALDTWDIDQLNRCDDYYKNKGVDRPMVYGVYQDWKPVVKLGE